MSDHESDPILRAVLAYWNRQKGDRAMPRRRDIDPVDIPKLLPHLVMLEVLDHGARFRLRLVGSAITAAYREDVTGKCLDEIHSGDRLEAVSSYYRRVCETRRPLFIRSHFVARPGLDYYTNRLLLPLSEDDASVGRVLGAFTTEYARGAGTEPPVSYTLEPAATLVKDVA